MSANPLPFLPRPEEYPPAGGDHYWAKSSRELKANLARAVPHDVLKELHRKSPGRHAAVAVRQFAMLAAASAISWLFTAPWIWIPAALDRRLDRVQFHRPPPRSRSSRGLQRAPAAGGARARDSLRDPLGDLRAPVHALAPDAPRGARRRRGGPEAPLPLAEAQPPLVQGALLHAGPVPDLFPRRRPRDRELSEDAEAPDRARARGHGRSPFRRDGGALRDRGRGRARAGLSGPVLRSSSRSPSP